MIIKYFNQISIDYLDDRLFKLKFCFQIYERLTRLWDEFYAFQL